MANQTQNQNQNNDPKSHTPANQSNNLNQGTVSTPKDDKQAEESRKQEEKKAEEQTQQNLNNEDEEARKEESAKAAEAQAKKEAEDREADEKRRLESEKANEAKNSKKDEDLNTHEQGNPSPDKTVKFETADHQTLYVQIGTEKFEGKVIHVPERLAGEAKNLLLNAGFRLKD